MTQPPHKPETLPYRPPAEFRSADPQLELYHPPLLPMAIAMRVWGFGLVAVGFMVFVLPRFEQIFKDFKTELPFITKVLLTVGRWTANDNGWLAVLPIVAALPFGIGYLMGLGVTDAEGYRFRRRWVSLLVVLLMGAFAAAILLSLFAPMISLIESVSGGGPKK